MEWREQSAVSCDEAYLEARRWIEVSGELSGRHTFESHLFCLTLIFIYHNVIFLSHLGTIYLSAVACFCSNIFFHAAV